MTNHSETPAADSVKQAIAAYWWMPLVRGLLLIVFGVIMFARPGVTALSLISLLGLYWIVDGILSIIEGLRGHTEKARVWTIVAGVFGILAGVIVLVNPLVAGAVGGALIAWLLGLAIIANGILLIFAGRNGEWTWWGLLMGILYVIFGVIVISNPLVSLVIGAWFFAFWAVVSGILAIVLAFTMRGLKKAA